MPKNARIENVLAYWTVDAATWRQFVSTVRRYQQLPAVDHCALQLRDEVPAGGVEVLVTEHAVSVGAEKFDFLYADSLAVTLRESWLEFGSDPSDTDRYIFPVPIDDRSRAEAARVADHFTHQMAERSRLAMEARARPTLSNRLLNFVEGHFVLATLLFFFVLIPAVVAFLTLLSVWFPAIKLSPDN
jgi:hypothetical protein